MRLRAAFALVAVTVAACTRPAPRVGTPANTSSTDLRAILAAANHCTVDSDCETIGSVCDIGCYPLVNRADSQRTREAVQRIVAASGATCRFSCPAPQPIHCASGRCEMSDR